MTAPCFCRNCRGRTINHGTTRGYKFYGCRCRDCREANRVSGMSFRRRHGVQPPSGPIPLELRTHGTRTTYHKGCRCSECREAERVYRAEYRRRSA